MKYFEKIAKKDRTIDDLISGSVAGTAAVLGTQPLEQLATRAATSNKVEINKAKKIIFKLLKKTPEISKVDKVLHKWKGSTPRALKGAMAAGITFGVHGAIKKHLNKNER